MMEEEEEVQNVSADEKCRYYHPVSTILQDGMFQSPAFELLLPTTLPASYRDDGLGGVPDSRMALGQ
jgi:hypothetical protein